MITSGDPAKTTEVADGVWQVCLPLPMRPSIVNVWLVRGGDGYTLVDTGMHMADSVAALRGALETLGLGPHDVAHIVCTHHHVDHYGASAPYRELTGARVHLHPLEAERAAGAGRARGEDPVWLGRHGVPAVPPEQQMPPASRWLGTVYCPAEPDMLLADADEVDLGGGRVLEVVWTPGHTAGHCCLRLRPDGVLFVGDHLLPKITPHVGVLPDGPENPLGDFLASQDKIARVEAQLVCPAHGRVYDDHVRRARQLVDFHRVRKLAMLEIVARGARTAYEVALEAFAIAADNRFQVLAATSETLAHLELLRREGRALRRDDDGVVRWEARRT